MSESPDTAAAIAALTRRVTALEDVNAIRKLHFAYGYYIDKCMYHEVVDLFADDSEQHFLNGIYKGKAGAHRLYCDWFRNLFTAATTAPMYGFLLDHLIMQDIIDIAPDGQTAKCARAASCRVACTSRSRSKIEGLPEMFWEGGIYENQYVKENGVWKIKLLNYNMLWQADYEGGWYNTDRAPAAADAHFPRRPDWAGRDQPRYPARLAEHASGSAALRPSGHRASRTPRRARHS